MMSGKLQEKVALITGGSGGIGAATAVAFAREGATGIGIHYSTSRRRAEDLAARIRSQGCDCRPIKADVSDRQQAFNLVEQVANAFGGLDVLVCYAGHPFVREEWFAPFEDLSYEILLKPLQVDLLGSVYCVQAASPHLQASANGRLILVSSTPALTGDTVGISYLLAKGALLSLTKALARVLGPSGVHVNCLVPGSIDTPAMASLTEEERRDLEAESVLRRMGSAEEVARKAVYLASTDSDFQTGTALVVDGGFAMQ